MPRRKAADAFKESLPGHPVGGHVEEFLIPAKFDEDGVQLTAAIGADGKEYVDPVPMAPPVGYTPPADLYEAIRRMISDERIRQGLEEEGFDTAEEADDFEIEDDPLDPLTPYERHFEPKAVAPAAAAPSQTEAPAAASEAKGGSGVVSPAAAERSEAPATKVT